MKRQEVSVDVSLMITTAVVYLGLAVSGWVLFRLIQACFWLPGYLKKQEEWNLRKSSESEPLCNNSSSESEEDKKNV